MNLYETVGAKPGVSAEELKDAIRRARSKAHPDREGGGEEAIKAVNKAAMILLDPEKRKAYDQTGDTVDKPADTVESMALQLLMQFLDQGVNIPGKSVLRTAKRCWQEKHTETKDSRQRIAAEEKKLLARRGAVKVKEGQTNLLHTLVDAKLAQIKGMWELQKTHEAVLEKVGRMLGEYEDLEQAEMDALQELNQQAIQPFKFTKY